MVARSVLIFFLLLKARHAAEIGADGIAVIAPFFLKPWNKGEWRPLNAQPLTRSASFCLHLQWLYLTHESKVSRTGGMKLRWHRAVQNIWPLRIHKRNYSIKGFQVFCRVIWLDHLPSPLPTTGSICRCLFGAGVHPLSYQLCAVSESHGKAWDHFFSRGIEVLSILRLQVPFRVEWVMNLKRNLTETSIVFQNIKLLLSPLLSLWKLFVVSKYTESF